VHAHAALRGRRDLGERADDAEAAAPQAAPLMQALAFANATPSTAVGPLHVGTPTTPDALTSTAPVFPFARAAQRSAAKAFG
jgi:hypothetical protein